MKKGFTLIEVLVATALVLVIFLAIFGAYQLGMKVVGLNQRKIVAMSIAQAEIEKIRNLPYLSVGTSGAELPYAKGILEPSTTTISNGVEYQIERKIKFIIDEADGVGSEDSCNWDYKRVEIKVSWSGFFASEVNAITDVSPKDKIEEIQVCQQQPGGILAVLVFDALGNPVSFPFIEIFNPQTDSLIDSANPGEGKYEFPLVSSTYKIKVSKSNYSSERTYGTTEIAIPEKPHPIVLENQITNISFSIDRLSSFSVSTLTMINEETFPVPNTTFNLRGEKLIGKDINENPIYKYSQNHSSDSQGRIDIPNLEWDNYFFSIDPATGLDLVSTEPSPQPVSLAPNTTSSVKLYLKAQNSFLVNVQNSETSEPVFSAEVRLFKSNYDKTQYTNEKGKSLFIPLDVADYNLEVSAPGYSTSSTMIFISGDTSATIKLKQIE